MTLLLHYFYTILWDVFLDEIPHINIAENVADTNGLKMV